MTLARRGIQEMVVLNLNDVINEYLDSPEFQKLAQFHEVVAYAKVNKVDILLLDMIMDPGNDGLETYRQILETTPHQKAIFASGYSETARVHKAQKMGAGDYVRKPYTIISIAQAISAEMEK